MRLPLAKMLNLTLGACLVASTLSSVASAKVTKPAPFRLTDSSLTDSQPMGVSIDDLVRYSPSRVRDAAVLQTLIKSSDVRVFDVNEALCTIPAVGVTKMIKQKDGTKRSVTANPIFQTVCGNAYLEQAPHSDDGKTATYQIAVLMQTQQGPAFRKISVEISPNGTAREVTKVQRLNDVLVSRTHFSISVGFVASVQVLQDVANDILIVNPIGNGGLTLPGPGQKVMTPMFQHATLRKDFTIPSLNLDYYYRQEPYIALVKSNGSPSDVAFHITIIQDPALWNNGKGSEFLMRGFDSHGCMRMRLHDLQILYTIVTQSAAALPVTVDYFASLMDQRGQPLGNDESDPINSVHPYPHMSSYQQERDVNKGQLDANGLPLAAATGRDTDPTINHHEILMDVIGGKIPYTNLLGFDYDDQQALATYQALLAKQSGSVKSKIARKPVISKPSTRAIDVAPVSINPISSYTMEPVSTGSQQ